MTVRHRGRESDDEPLKSYGGTKRAVNNYYADECKIAICARAQHKHNKTTTYFHHRKQQTNVKQDRKQNTNAH